MIRRDYTGRDGKKIIELLPETKDEERKLQELIDAGAIEMWDSFSEFSEDKDEVIEQGEL